MYFPLHIQTNASVVRNYATRLTYLVMYYHVWKLNIRKELADHLVQERTITTYWERLVRVSTKISPIRRPFMAP
jgi:hypothetical protein